MSSNKSLGKIISTNVSLKKGTAKHSVSNVVIDEFGVVGDAHAGPGHRQISLLSEASINEFSKTADREFQTGDFGENLTFKDLDFKKFGLLDRLKINNVILEITQFGKKCHGDGCAIYREIGKCIMPKEGFFARVIHPGEISGGDTIHYEPYFLKLLVITLSDRAARGVYEDKSGETAVQLLKEFFNSNHWHLQIEKIILPDEPKQLAQHLHQAVKNKIDIIFTLGGTGVGARDITPEVVNKICKKSLTRIMDYICLKYGATHPAALLSRSVAGVADQTQIYALPGSPRAVTEYLTEIFQVLEHVIFMLHSVDRHSSQ